MPVADQSAAWNSLAASFGNMGDRLFGMAARAAEVDGTAKGEAAGASGEFQLREAGTIRADAFNQAATRTARTATQHKLITGLEDLATAHPNDGAAFQAGAQALREEYVQKLPPALRDEMAMSFDRLRMPYERDYARFEQKAMLDQAKAEAMPAIDAQTKALGRLAYSGGLDAASDDAIAGEMSTLMVTLSAYGPKTEFTIGGRTFEADEDRAGVFSATDIQAQLLNAGEGVALNRTKGAFDRLDTPEARQAFAEDFRKDYEKGDGVTAIMDLSTVEQLERYFGATLREDAAAARAATAERNAATRAARATLKADVSEYRAFASNGLVPDQADLSRMRREAAALGDSDLIEDIDNIAITSTLVRETALMPPVQTEARIRELRANGAGGMSPDQAQEVMALETGLRRAREGLARDPVAFAIGAGVVPDIPLVLDGPEAETNLRGRAGRAHLIEARYGVRTGLFNKAETEELQRIEREAPGQLAPLAATIIATSGSKARQYLGELSDDAPMLAQMGALLDSGGDPRAVKDAARGMQVRADNPGVAKGFSTTDTSETMTTLLAPLDAVPSAKARIQRTAENIYLGRMGLNAEYDDAEMARAVEEAMGARFVGPQKIKFGGKATIKPDGMGNNTSVLVPSWMRADEADSVFTNLTLEDYEAAGGVPVSLDGEPLPLRDLRRAKLVTLDEGRYALQLRMRNGEPEFAGGDGPRGIYELDVNALRDTIAVRFPEAVGR